MFLYAFGVPIFIYIGLDYLHVHGKEFRPEERAKYGYLYYKYRNKMWWWEPLVILPRKGLIGIIGLFTSYERLMLLQASLTLMMIVFYLTLHLQRKPFIEEFLNKMELYALVNHFFILLLGCIFLSESFTSAPTANSAYAYAVIASVMFTLYSLLKFTVKELSDEGIFTMLRLTVKTALIKRLAKVKGRIFDEEDEEKKLTRGKSKQLSRLGDRRSSIFKREKSLHSKIAKLNAGGVKRERSITSKFYHQVKKASNLRRASVSLQQHQAKKRLKRRLTKRNSLAKITPAPPSIPNPNNKKKKPTHKPPSRPPPGVRVNGIAAAAVKNPTGLKIKKPFLRRQRSITSKLLDESIDGKELRKEKFEKLKTVSQKKLIRRLSARKNSMRNVLVEANDSDDASTTEKLETSISNKTKQGKQSLGFNKVKGALSKFMATQAFSTMHKKNKKKEEEKRQTVKINKEFGNYLQTMNVGNNDDEKGELAFGKVKGALAKVTAGRTFASMHMEKRKKANEKKETMKTNNMFGTYLQEMEIGDEDNETRKQDKKANIRFSKGGRRRRVSQSVRTLQRLHNSYSSEKTKREKLADQVREQQRRNSKKKLKERKSIINGDLDPEKVKRQNNTNNNKHHDLHIDAVTDEYHSNMSNYEKEKELIKHKQRENTQKKLNQRQRRNSNMEQEKVNNNEEKKKVEAISNPMPYKSNAKKPTKLIGSLVAKYGLDDTLMSNKTHSKPLAGVESRQEEAAKHGDK